MSSSPLSPKILKGGIVLMKETGSNYTIDKIIPLQYNPETLSRTLQPQGMGTGANRSEPLRLKGPPIETYSLDAELDATDLLEAQDHNTLELGLQPALTVLEQIVYPKSAVLYSNNMLANSGTLDIIPMTGPLVLFIWSKNRVAPVQITNFSIKEEAFDTNLNPIRAKISLSMKVLTIDDLGFDHKGGSLYMAYQKQKESLAIKFKAGKLGTFGINKI
jgi:hypothetical protein